MASSCPTYQSVFLPPPPLFLRRSTSAMFFNESSNWSRGGKPSGNQGEFWHTGTRLVRQPSLKKFDGAARKCYSWDNSKRDSELWLPGSSDCFCYVHLYEKGQSQRGPAIKIQFESLLAAQCQPLIEAFVDRSVSEEEAYENGRVDLYIPAPAGASRSQAAQYHLSIRNLFAWVCRRSVVGEHLGNALIRLANAMDDFREPEADNAQDLMNYLDEEGYLDMRNQPSHALGILHLAEALQVEDWYTDAFAHCVGMSEQLYKHSEYSRISVASRKLIRKARVDMDFRLSRAGAMLGDLLDEELSETHLGLSTGARAHLDQFRAYVHQFYCTRFGTFPPPTDARGSTIFPPAAVRCMTADFKALYHYLVDETFTTTDNAPSVAQGGLCALQSVHEFDLCHNFSPLAHPLPLLPTLTTKDTRRRHSSLPWFGSTRTKPRSAANQRIQTHAALMRATHHTDAAVLDNELVMAYRDFEEASTMATHQPHSKKRGVVAETSSDARKVRWLFIYATYQTLRSCADVPIAVRYAENVNYHLGVSTADLPPWQAQTRRPATSYEYGAVRPTPPERGRSIGAAPLLSPAVASQSSLDSFVFEIKPDIDYFALTHPENASAETLLPRSRSQSLTRNISLRRSFSAFRNSVSITKRPAAATPASPSSRAGVRRRSVYHEILVQGYGNGTNDVVVDHGPPPALTVMTRTTNFAPIASRSSSSATNNSANSLSGMSTAPTTVDSPTSARAGAGGSWRSVRTLVHDEEACVPKVVKRVYSNDDMLNNAAPPPLPRRSSKRHIRAGGAVGAANRQRWSLVDVSASLREDEDCDSEEGEGEEMAPDPLRIRKVSDGGCEVTGFGTGELSVWEQYADLGGLRTVGVAS